MTGHELYGHEIVGVAPFKPTALATCLLPSPEVGLFCSLAAGHDGEHEVQVPAFVTLLTFANEPEPEPEPEATFERTFLDTLVVARPARPRGVPTPRDLHPTPASVATADWRCGRCGSDQWVGWRSAPGAPRMTQCVPCGHVQPLPTGGQQ